MPSPRSHQRHIHADESLARHAAATRSQVAFRGEGPRQHRQPSTSPDLIRPAMPTSILKKPQKSAHTGTSPDLPTDPVSSPTLVAARPQKQQEQDRHPSNDEEVDDRSPGQSARPPTPPKRQSESTDSASKKTASSTTASGRGKRRPVMVRNRSSHSSSGTTSSGKCSDRSPRLASDDDATPHVSVRQASNSGAKDSWVVDEDFRSRFASKTMAPLASSSTAAVTTASGPLSELASAGKGKSKAPAIVDDVAPLKPEGPSASTAHDESRPLARTKSQLTLLLEQDRQAGEVARREHDGQPR